MKFIRFLYAITLAFMLSTAFAGCGGGGGGGDSTTTTSDSTTTTNTDETTETDNNVTQVEGTEGNPKVLSLDTNYTFDISSDDSADSLYLKVTTNSAGYYYFKATSEAQADSIRAVQVLLYQDQFEGYPSTAYFGSMLAQLKADTTYYVELQNTTAETLSCDFKIAEIGTLNEGSVSDPVAMDLDETYSAKVGYESNGSQNSYYTFTTSDKPYYLISTTDEDLEVALYSGSDFSSLVGTATDGKLGKELNANTEYFIKVTNTDNSVTFHDIKVSSMETLNEGSLDNPVVLTVDANHSAKIGSSEQLLENSYYKFTTQNAAKYEITASNTSLYMYLYTDASFDDAYKVYTSYDGSFEWDMNESSTYYLKVYNPGDSVETFSLLVASIDEGTQDYPVNLPLETVHSGKIGSDTGTYQNFYQFTTNNEGYYEISALESTLDIYVLEGDTWFTYFASATGGVVTTYLDANTTYHLWVENNLNSDIAFDLKITEKGKTNEGDVGSPMSLTLNTLHNAKVGINDGSGSENSYYSFTTNDAAIYTITTLNTNPDSRLDIELFSDSNFSNSGTSIDDAQRTTIGLDANTTYYLKVNNYLGSDNVTFDLDILAPNEVSTISIDENVSSSPVALAIGSQYTAHVKTSTTGGEYGYYSFTTGSDSSKKVLIAFRDASPSADLDIHVYKDANFSNYLGTVTTSPASLSNYDTNSTYYFKIENVSNTVDITYNLLLQVDP